MMNDEKLHQEPATSDQGKRRELSFLQLNFKQVSHHSSFITHHSPFTRLR